MNAAGMVPLADEDAPTVRVAERIEPVGAGCVPAGGFEVPEDEEDDEPQPDKSAGEAHAAASSADERRSSRRLTMFVRRGAAAGRFVATLGLRSLDIGAGRGWCARSLAQSMVRQRADARAGCRGRRSRTLRGLG